MILWLVLAVTAGASAVWWASEPSRRRKVLFESPIILRTGSTMVGRFVSEGDVPCAVEVVFRRSSGPFEALSEAVGGGWGVGPDGPAGFAATYVARREGVVVARGTTKEQLTGWFGLEDVAVQVDTWIEGGSSAPMDIEIRVDRAVEALAGWEARVRVVHAGDWISYAGLESAWRFFLVFVAAIGLGLGLLVAYLVRRRRALRASTSA